MKKKKAVIIIASSILAVIIAITATVSALKIDLMGMGNMLFAGTAIAMFTQSMPNPPKPEITYGEFPISVTFEVDGEIKVVEDTVICEFDGFESLGAAGKYRKWKKHLKSGNERLTLWRVENAETTFEFSVAYGQPDYYMGDLRYESKEEYEKKMSDDRYIGYTQCKNGVQKGYSILKEEVWEKYKLKIINIKYSKPIQNTFK